MDQYSHSSACKTWSWNESLGPANARELLALALFPLTVRWSVGVFESAQQNLYSQMQPIKAVSRLKPLLVTLDGPMAQFGPNTLCCSSTIGFSSSPAAPASSPTPMPLWLLEWHLAISQFAKRRAAGASQNTCQMFE